MSQVIVLVVTSRVIILSRERQPKQERQRKNKERTKEEIAIRGVLSGAEGVSWFSEYIATRLQEFRKCSQVVLCKEERELSLICAFHAKAVERKELS